MITVEEKRKDAAETLAALGVKAESEVSTIRAGHPRKIRAFVVSSGRIVDVTPTVARLLDRKLDKDGRIFMRGGGSNPCFDLVWEISQTMFGNGYALKGCEL